MFLAAFTSALAWNPHATQQKSAWLSRDSDATYRHFEQVCDAYAAGTATMPHPFFRPCHSRVVRNRPKALSRIERFKPAFWRTCLPGRSTVPLPKR
jgi:hypothetical protein